MKYRKKQVIVEAFQITEDTYDMIHKWSGGRVCISPVIESTKNNPKGIYWQIGTLEGVMTAITNDYIIKGIEGEFYPCKPEIFEKTYERIEEKR